MGIFIAKGWVGGRGKFEEEANGRGLGAAAKSRFLATLGMTGLF
jgi:hypothetical protein